MGVDARKRVSSDGARDCRTWKNPEAGGRARKLEGFSKTPSTDRNIKRRRAGESRDPKQITPNRRIG